ncbi:MAG: hypothetical protein M1840_006511 [Geoglossum simile]|nr:MAG: hypothetical protein M1840_006511 [Geoglossum simile]
MARRKSGPISAPQQHPTPIASQDYNQQQEKVSGNAEHADTISRTDAECDGDDDGDGDDDSNDDGDDDGNVESAETISRAETRSLNWAEPPHKGEQQGKSKKRQQDDGDAESAESTMDEGDPGTEDELETMYELRLGELEKEEEGEEDPD